MELQSTHDAHSATSYSSRYDMEHGTMKIIHSCDSCLFYHPDNSECRRSPPVRLPRRFAEDATPESRTRDEELLWGWPSVLGSDWCGEYYE